MKADLLLKLADLLEKDAADADGIKFDFTEWGAVKNTEKVASCDTEACAMGLAAISGAFAEQGLGFKFFKWDDKQPHGIDFTLNGRSASGIDAAIWVFDLSYAAADYLFTNDSDLKHTTEAGGEREVAARIRRYVELDGNLGELQDERGYHHY